MTTTEFPVNLAEDNEGLGTLLISNAALLIRPAIPGQYPASVQHDSGRAYQILDIGNDMGIYGWHIISQLSPEATFHMLDRVFYAYVDACCLSLWCDARVNYIVDGRTVQVKEHGFDDGNYTMFFNVYCGIAENETEAFLTTLTDNIDGPFIVVRPDSSPDGYNVHGYTVNQSSGDISSTPLHSCETVGCHDPAGSDGICSKHGITEDLAGDPRYADLFDEHA